MIEKFEKIEKTLDDIESKIAEIRELVSGIGSEIATDNGKSLFDRALSATENDELHKRIANKVDDLFSGWTDYWNTRWMARLVTRDIKNRITESTLGRRDVPVKKIPSGYLDDAFSIVKAYTEDDANKAINARPDYFKKISEDKWLPEWFSKTE